MGKQKKAINPTVGVSFFPFEEEPIVKSDSRTTNDIEDERNNGEWLHCDVDEKNKQDIIDNSTILLQCISAYANNIAGFGIGIQYRSDYKNEETPEMIQEYNKVKEIVDCFSLEDDTKEIFKTLIDDVESFGIGYLEVIRNIEGLPVELVNISPVSSVEKSRRGDYVDYQYTTENGNIISRKKRFRKYKQTVNAKSVYLKEFGDPRVMDKRTGEYISSDKSISRQDVANEVIEFKNSKRKPYGDVRWIGCVKPLVGADLAEELNLNYFRNGRHTPLAILIENGHLTEQAKTKLKEYTDAIRGAKSQHGFLILETEPIQQDLGWNKENPPKITIKDMASVLQHDELFSDYIENTRKKIQSAYKLPDIYVGRTTDYNRSTVYAAITLTEQQVFQPYRKRLDYMINRRILQDYQFKYCDVFFQSPELNNPDDIKTIFDATGPYGGIPLNLAKEISYKYLHLDCNDYDIKNANLPLSLIQQQATQGESFSSQTQTQIEKARSNEDYDIIPILKSMHDKFKEMELRNGFENQEDD